MNKGASTKFTSESEGSDIRLGSICHIVTSGGQTCVRDMVITSKFASAEIVKCPGYDFW